MTSKPCIFCGILCLLLVIGVTGKAWAQYKEFDLGRFRAGDNVAVPLEETLSAGLTIAAANIDVSGHLHKNLTALGANIAIPGHVDGPSKAFGANIDLPGVFGGHVTAAGANITISGTFEADVEALGARITLLPTAVIRGRLIYAAAILEQQPGAQVFGGIIPKMTALRSGADAGWAAKALDLLKKGAILFWLGSLAALIMVGIIIHRLFPNHLERIDALISVQPWANLGIGLVFLAVVPAAILMALMTLVGIPAAIIAAMLYGIALYISRIFVGLWVGRWIVSRLRKTRTEAFYWPLFLGTTILALIGLIPFVGWFFRLFCMLIGLGGLWLATWQSIQSNRLH